MFKKIKKWYKQGLWSVQMVHQALDKGILTTDEAAEILAEQGGINNE